MVINCTEYDDKQGTVGLLKSFMNDSGHIA